MSSQLRDPSSKESAALTTDTFDLHRRDRGAPQPGAPQDLLAIDVHGAWPRKLLPGKGHGQRCLGEPRPTDLPKAQRPPGGAADVAEIAQLFRLVAGKRNQLCLLLRAA